MEISSTEHERHQTLLETIDESRSFKRNPCTWVTFWGNAGATGVMFVILVALSGWSISIGQDVSRLVSQGGETLADVQELIPDMKLSLQLLRDICAHQNFTRNYGNICNK